MPQRVIRLIFAKLSLLNMLCFICIGCGHCKSTKPHFEEAAMKMQDEGNKIMAAVDCTVETGWSYYYQ